MAQDRSLPPEFASYPRDMRGYGPLPPHPQWPGDARLALQFVVNYEEGGENNILHGDSASEAFLSEIVGAQPLAGVRHMNMESIYEYGSRAGFWRLHRLFTQRDMPVTVFGVAMALARNPAAVEAMQAADWEIASHGYRWIDYQFVPEEIERRHLGLAIELHEQGDRRPARWAGISDAAAPTPGAWSPRKAASSTIPTAMPMSCPIGSRSPGGPSSSSPIRSTPMTCALPPARASIPGTSSSPI